MEIEIRVAEDQAGDDIRSLVQWLRADEELRPAVVREAQSVPHPEEMGPITDLLQVAGSPEVVAALIGSVTTWLVTRPRRLRIRLRHGDREVEVEGSPSDDPEELADELMNRLNES